MAEARVSVDLDQFNCPICLDLLKDPVSVNCGHSFCMTCIKTKWDQDDARGIYSCPLCRQDFTPRPVLGRNTMLAEMVERLKKTHAPDTSLAGPEDVECDVCVGRKNKAVKTCLVCLASYCRPHFQLHNELNPRNKHKVIGASDRLRDRVCPYHNRLMEVFCHTEQRSMCHECATFCYRNHNTNTITQERSLRQGQIRGIREQIKQRVHETENRLQDLRKTIQSIMSSSKILLDQNERTFVRLIQSAEKKRSQITKMIRDTEKSGVSRAEEILKHLEKEMARLKKRDTELNQLPAIEDDFLFLETSKPLFDFSMVENVPNINANLSIFKDLQNTVSEITKKMEAFCTTELEKKNRSVKSAAMVQTSHPVLREDFLQYSRQITVDDSTIHKNLHLSGDKRRITYSETGQQYPGDGRFQDHTQALCGQVTGRCYWEVEAGGPKVYIALTHIQELMFVSSCPLSGFGHNEFSWSLCCTPSKCSFFHADKQTVIAEPLPSKVGVYLDQEAGILAFYSVTDVMTLLYRVQTTFTGPVYPGFWVFDRSHVKISEHNSKALFRLPKLRATPRLLG